MLPVMKRMLPCLLLAGCAGGPEPAPAAQQMVGMYVYLADAASFTDCATGQRYPVLIEGDHLAVERAYLAHRLGPGVPGQLTVRGRVVERPVEPGMAPRPQLLIEHFDTFRPAATCAAFATSTASFTATFWRLVEVEEHAVVPQPAEEDAPHVQFTAGEVSGYSGCNRFFGRATRHRDELHFGVIASTRRACPSRAAADFERRLLGALSRVASFSVRGEALELIDDNGAVLVRAEAGEAPTSVSGGISA